MKKRVLITGGLGFLGIHSVEKWKANDWNVTVIDNLSSNVVGKDHSSLDSVDVIISDIVDVKWKHLPKFDLILHYASIVGPVGVLKHAGNMANAILNDVYWVVDGALKNDCPVIFVSTSEIYGWRDKKSYLQEHDDKVIHGDFTVRGEYSVAKMLGEIVIANTGKVKNQFRYQLIRPFNITGKYQTPENGFVLPRFVLQALNGEDITVYYKGNQIRSFTWVNDVVDGIYLTSIAPPAQWNQEWNIGNKNNEESILDLANRVKRLTNSSSNIIHVDPKTLHGALFEEAPEKIANATKIEVRLGWRPTKSIEDIVLEVIEYWSGKEASTWNHPIWEGVYSCWSDLPEYDIMGCTEWDEKQRKKLNDTREKTSKVFEESRFLLASLSSADRTFLDYGGSLGLTYEAIKDVTSITGYHVIEAPLIVQSGSELFQDGVVKFHTIDVEPQEVDVLYVRTALQYAENWRSELDALIKWSPSKIVMANTSTGPIPTYLTFQNWYGKKVPYWFINDDELIEAITSHGYRLDHRSTCEDTIYGFVGDNGAYTVPEDMILKTTVNLRFTKNVPAQ